MKIEVEFLAVGDKTKAGDAIVVRYGEEYDYRLMIVDGGTAETGVKLVEHLRKEFGANVFVEHVLLTHSDLDHASGLREVLREIPVRNLWLHVPWVHAEETLHLFKNKNWTAEGLAKSIRDEYGIIQELIELAQSVNCPIYFPFQGSLVGPFVVMSPSRAEYCFLLPQFSKTPEPDEDLIKSAGRWIGKGQLNFLRGLIELAAGAAQSWTQESWYVEKLKDGGITSASNESSVVLYADAGVGQRILLTGDAGTSALSWVAKYAKNRGMPLQNFSFVQIPHHGSRRNVGPTILNTLLGPIQPEGTKRFAAFVSAPAEDDKHPRKIVLNAFARRGGHVIATQGVNKVHYGGFARRAGYSDVNAIPFSNVVEDYD